MSARSVSLLLSPLLVQPLVRPITAVPVHKSSRPLHATFLLRGDKGCCQALTSEIVQCHNCRGYHSSSQYARTNCAGTGLSLSPDTWPHCSISDLSDTPFDLFRIPSYLCRIHWPSLFQCLNLALWPNNKIRYGMFSQHVRQLRPPIQHNADKHSCKRFQRYL